MFPEVAPNGAVSRKRESFDQMKQGKRPGGLPKRVPGIDGTMRQPVAALRLHGSPATVADGLSPSCKGRDMKN